MDTTEQTPTISKNIEQVNFNYGKDFIIEPINGAQVLRKCITDVYNTALPEVELTVGENGDGDSKTTINFQDECAKQLDQTISQLDGMKGGFIGYLAWAYAMMTLFYIMGEYSHVLTMLDMIDKCTTSIEKYIVTGAYDNNFVNYWYGTSDTSSLKYADDAVVTARYIHNKSNSFESGYSLITTSMLKCFVVNDMKGATDELNNLRSIIKQIKEFIVEEQKRSENETKQEIVEENTDESEDNTSIES